MLGGGEVAVDIADILLHAAIILIPTGIAHQWPEPAAVVTLGAFVVAATGLEDVERTADKWYRI